MMIYPMFSIKDAKVGFLAPTCEATAASAIRNFEHAVMNIDGLFYSHAEDYELYHIANFDVDSGRVESIDPEFLVSAISVKKNIKKGK